MTTIITGEKGTGKTTFLIKLIGLLKTRGNACGIITPPVYGTNGGKKGFDALDVATEESWPLGRTNGELEGPVYGPYSFSREGLERAVSVFKKAAENDCPFIFLDEIGPLELEKKAGFYPLLSLLPEISAEKSLYLVVRPSLVDKVADSLFEGKEFRVITVSVKNRDSDLLLKKTAGQD